MNILYVEDEPADAQLVQRYVQLTPHQLTVTPTIQEAMDSLESKPDLILVDVLLNQDKVGYKFVRELRTRGYTQAIVAVTGLVLAHDIEQCYEAGFTEVLAKPYAIQELVE